MVGLGVVCLGFELDEAAVVRAARVELVAGGKETWWSGAESGVEGPNSRMRVRGATRGPGGVARRTILCGGVGMSSGGVGGGASWTREMA